MHFWRTKGTLTADKARVKMALPQPQRGVYSETPRGSQTLGQHIYQNFFIYLINCSTFGTICALDRAVRS